MSDKLIKLSHLDYVKNALDEKLDLSGGTMTGTITGNITSPLSSNNEKSILTNVGLSHFNGNNAITLSYAELEKMVGNNTYYLSIPDKTGTIAITNDLNWTLLTTITSRIQTPISLGDLSNYHEILISVYNGTTIRCSDILPMSLVTGNTIGVSPMYGNTAQSTVVIDATTVTSSTYTCPNYVTNSNIKVYAR